MGCCFSGEKEDEYSVSLPCMFEKIWPTRSRSSKKLFLRRAYLAHWEKFCTRKVPWKLARKCTDGGVLVYRLFCVDKKSLRKLIELDSMTILIIGLVQWCKPKNVQSRSNFSFPTITFCVTSRFAGWSHVELYPFSYPWNDANLMCSNAWQGGYLSYWGYLVSLLFVRTRGMMRGVHYWVMGHTARHRIYQSKSTLQYGGPNRSLIGFAGILLV